MRGLVEEPRQTDHPKPAHLNKALKRIEAIQERALPHAEMVLDNIARQLTDNCRIHKFGGSERPYSLITSAQLPPQFLLETPLPDPGSKPKEKVIFVIFAGFGGNITSGLPQAMEEMFGFIKSQKDGEDGPAIDCYVVGQPTRADKTWRKGLKTKGLAMHGEAAGNLLNKILANENPDKTKLVLLGESMSTYTAGFATQHLDDRWIPKTELFQNNPPGTHREKNSHPIIHFPSRVQLGIGYGLEIAKRKRKNKREGTPDSAIEDREFKTAVAPFLRKRGIEIAGRDMFRSLTRAQLRDLWNLGKRPPLPKTPVKPEITHGVNDLTRWSPRDRFAYRKGQHVKSEANVLLRLTPTNHTLDDLSPKRINSMIEVLLDKEQLLDSLEAKILDVNWHDDHTYPAPYHYEHLWLWDSIFAANINGQRGEIGKAAIEIGAVLSGVDPETGFIPNMQYKTGRNWHDIESVTFKNPDFGSSYTQPPIIAWGAWQTYQIFLEQDRKEEGRNFLDGQYEAMDKFYSYFSEHRQNGDGSLLIGNTFPHETGRDSDPALRPEVPFIKGKGRSVGLLNSLIDYGTALSLNTKLKWKDEYPEKGRPTATEVIDFAARKVRRQEKGIIRTDWNPEKVRDVYWINDVMFNVLYVNNLRYMAGISKELGKHDKEEEYIKLANNVEAEIIDKIWDPQTRFFYNLDKNGKQIQIPSITGLFATCLDTIPEDKLSAVVDKMEDDNWFNTEFPFPSVPAHSPYYKPDYSEKRLWKRGEVWINANQLIAEEGLVKQIQRPDISPKLRSRMVNVLRKLVEKTEGLVNTDLLENGTTHEFYNAETGEGYRIKGFTWTLGGRHMHKSKDLLEKMEEQFA